MRWTINEFNRLCELMRSGKDSNEIAMIMGRSVASIRNKVEKSHLKFNDYKPIKEIKKCKNCEINDVGKHGTEFCSHSCSATYNNTGRIKKDGHKRTKEGRKIKGKCLNCGEDRTNEIYCSNKCMSEHKRNVVFEKIENGDTTLYYRNYKKYLIVKYGEKCMECGWSEVNPYSGKVPIELEHIDGDSENNSLDNLKILCPNCHALTPTYKALNKGNGRHKRMVRYNEGKSY